MFQCDQLIYIQMQKTGCTHIALLLSKLFDGKQIGKHNAATQDQIASTNKLFISSIRNPWDWYLSLWTYGVHGNGWLWQRLTQRSLFHAIKYSIFRNSKTLRFTLFHELTKNVALWRDVYDRSDNVKSFRKWLKLVHDPDNCHFLGEGYEHTAITDICGFMTYRYLYLCCQNVNVLKNPKLISNYADLVQFETNNCYIDNFIRQESLEDGLCKAVENVRPLTQEERRNIFSSEKTNTSKRAFPVSWYYDKESIELIHNRDRLLIEKFDYSPPDLSH